MTTIFFWHNGKRYKLTAPRAKWHTLDEDSVVSFVSVRVPATTIKRVGVATIGHVLRDAGIVVERLGCHCRHCMAGWDCCGRLFPYAVRTKRVKRGLSIRVSYTRNI